MAPGGPIQPPASSKAHWNSASCSLMYLLSVAASGATGAEQNGYDRDCLALGRKCWVTAGQGVLKTVHKTLPD